MICPACQNTLTTQDVAGITVDVCRDGCGGIWFDHFELSKVDEQHEHAGEALMDIPRRADIRIDPQAKRPCPRCDGVIMMQHFFSIKRRVVVDECAECGGLWLDAGELAEIRGLFPDSAARQAATTAYFNDLAAAMTSSAKTGKALRFVSRADPGNGQQAAA